MTIRPDLTVGVRRSARVHPVGKHLALAGERFVVHGVTYGSFGRRDDGHRFPAPSQVRADFGAMTAVGINTVRIYEAPSRDVLDTAAEHGLQLIVGLDYHDWRMENTPGRATRRKIRAAGLHAVRHTMEICSGRPEVLAVSVGNEVPADIVRAHGIGHVEDTLSELVQAVHAADPDMLATYTNFPTTEYLQVDDVDLFTFNVFLEDPASFKKYLRHLQVVSGAKPLVITELGLAAEVHGEEAQATLLDRQLAIVDEVGCAGATIFSWTDEWTVADNHVEGWGFGLTTHDRRPKQAIESVKTWTTRSLKDLRDTWPRVSVVVCAYNEERTIEECLASLEACDYPDLEVILCDDGSSDRTLQISQRFPFRIIELPHGGLSRARNAGIEAASGEIVAFLDADAVCHPQWPWFLVMSFDDERVAATGGPNLPFPAAGLVERAVALSPGAPTEVLLTDDRAEHVAGCNMAFRREDILAIGGFDPAYTAAGDDVDVCWKLLDAGREIAFSPAAQISHHRRAKLRGYLRQQRGYGRAEKLLSGPHRHRFNALGQARWAGCIYGGVGLLPTLLRPVVYHGHQGHAPFQSVSGRRSESAAAWTSALLPFGLPIGLAGLALGLVTPWAFVVPALVLLSVGANLAAMVTSVRPDRREPQPMKLRLLVGLLHLLQPFVRTWGRLRGHELATDENVSGPAWNGDRATWLRQLDTNLRAQGLGVHIGQPHDPWDLKVTSRSLLRARISTAISWRWVPHASVSVSPTAQSIVLCALLPLTLLWSVTALVVTGLGLAATMLWQYRRLTGKVEQVLQTTTSGAGA